MPTNIKHEALDKLVKIRLQLVELQAKATQLETIILGDTARPRASYGDLTNRILAILDHPMTAREIANACNNGGYAGTYAALKHADSKLSRMVRRLPDGRWVRNDASLPEKTPASPASVPAKGMSERLSSIQKQRYASAKANPLGLTDRQQACLDAVKDGARSLSEVCRSVQGYSSGAVHGILAKLIKRGLITKKGWDYAIKP